MSSTERGAGSKSFSRQSERMQSADLLIRPGTPEDTDRILGLIRLSLGEGKIPRDRAYWDWKHHQNPFGLSPILLAHAGSELVGLRVFMRWEWRSKGETIRAVRAVDTATHPGWQGRGIFSRLTKSLVQSMTEDGVQFVFNTPNDKSRPGYLKMGWSTVGRTDLWICPLRPLRIGRAIAKRSVGSGGELASLPMAAGSFETVDALCSGSECSKFFASMDSSTQLPLHTLRRAEYLRWRYADIPGFRYHALFELDERDGAALIFRYKDQGSLLEMRICELFVGRTRRSRGLARALLGRLRRESGADYMSVMASPGTGDPMLLLGSGFMPAPRVGPVLAVRPLNAASMSANPLLRSDWRLAIGDLELF